MLNTENNMMKTFTLSVLFLLATLNCFCTTWRITNSGFTFSPSSLTITLGDTVIFDLDSDHNSAEVSEATWNANGSTPLPGGWITPFGGGMVLPADLTVGNHFYVCQPHAGMGMKGRITVEQSTSIEESSIFRNVSIFPNPSAGKIHLQLDQDLLTNQSGLEIYDFQGIQVYKLSKLDEKTAQEIDLSHLNKGFYYIKFYDGKAILTRKLIIQ